MPSRSSVRVSVSPSRAGTRRDRRRRCPRCPSRSRRHARRQLRHDHPSQVHDEGPQQQHQQSEQGGEERPRYSHPTRAASPATNAAGPRESSRVGRDVFERGAPPRGPHAHLRTVLPQDGDSLHLRVGTVGVTKAALRREIAAHRAALTPRQLDVAGEKLAAAVLPALRDRGCVACYVDIPPNRPPGHCLRHCATAGTACCCRSCVPIAIWAGVVTPRPDSCPRWRPPRTRWS